MNVFHSLKSETNILDSNTEKSHFYDFSKETNIINLNGQFQKNHSSYFLTPESIKQSRHFLQNSSIENVQFIYNKKKRKTDRFKNVFPKWVRCIILPLYKVLINLQFDFDLRIRQKVDCFKMLIEEVLRLPQMEFLVSSDCFGFDPKTRSLVFSILEDKFKKMQIESQNKEKFVLNKNRFDESFSIEV